MPTAANRSPIVPGPSSQAVIPLPGVHGGDFFKISFLSVRQEGATMARSDARRWRFRRADTGGSTLRWARILVCGSEWAMSLDCKGGHAARFLSRSGPTRHVIQPSYLRRPPSSFDTLKIADAAAAGSEDRKAAFRLRCILYGNIKPPFKS